MPCSCGCGGKKRNKPASKTPMVSVRVGKGCKRRRRIERDFVILTGKRRGTITNFSITGSAEPCTPLIAVGKSFADASSCLLKNRFLVGGTSEISTAFTRIRDNRGRKLGFLK